MHLHTRVGLLVTLASVDWILGQSSLPNLSLAPANATVSTGVNVIMGCKTLSKVLRCQWSHNGRLLSSFDPVHEGDCTLVLKRVQSRHRGHYRCALTPTHGVRIISQKAHLSVIDSSMKEAKDMMEYGSLFLVRSKEGVSINFMASTSISIIKCTWIPPQGIVNTTRTIRPSKATNESCNLSLSSDEQSQLTSWSGSWSVVVHIAEDNRSFSRTFDLTMLPVLTRDTPDTISLSILFILALALSSVVFVASLGICLCCKKKVETKKEIVATKSFVKNPLYVVSNEKEGETAENLSADAAAGSESKKVDSVLRDADENLREAEQQCTSRYAYLTLVCDDLRGKKDLDESYEEVRRPEPPYENGDWNKTMSNVMDAFDDLEKRLQCNTEHIPNETVIN